jgi:DNA-binding transcriptional ArsR family regulator
MVKYYQDQLDYVFFALADKTRREILLDLRGGFKTAQELASPHSISLPAISKHLKVLERATLLRREKRGRQHFFSLEKESLKSVTDWVGFFEHFWSAKFDSLEKYLNDQAGE